MKRANVFAALLVAVFSIAAAARAADGDLDPTFQGDGLWIHNVSTTGPKRVAVAPDGRLIIGYTSASGLGVPDAMRFVPVPDQGATIWCGEYDPELGGTNEDVLADIEVDGNRLFLAGRAAGPPGDPDAQLAIAAFDLDSCDLDPTFGGANGYLWASTTPRDAAGIELGLGGRVLIAAKAGPAGDRHLVHYAVDTIGVTDNGYGFEAVTFLSAYGATSFEPKDQFRQPDGKVLVVGDVVLPGGDIDVGVVRFDATGAVDETFSVDGIAAFAYDVIDSGDDRAFAVAALPDGRIVIAGSVERAGGFQAAIAILTSTGGYFNAFGSFGRYSFDFAAGEGSYLTALAIQGDGRIVAAGMSYFSILADFAVARFLPSGAQPLDTSFSGDGKRVIDFDAGGPADFADSVTLEQGGKITVVGTVQTATYVGIGAARLQNSYIFADGFEWGSTAGWSLPGAG